MMECTIDDLYAHMMDLRRVLTDIEWSGPFGLPMCPDCGHSLQHHDDCKLAALLAIKPPKDRYAGEYKTKRDRSTKRILLELYNQLATCRSVSMNSIADVLPYSKSTVCAYYQRLVREGLVVKHGESLSDSEITEAGLQKLGIG